MSRMHLAAATLAVMAFGCASAEQTNPSDPATWDVDADAAVVHRAFAEVRSSFLDGGSAAGMEVLADLTWQQLTADELLGCTFDGLTYTDLDDQDYVSDWYWENLRSDEGWEADGQLPSDDGWRVYLADNTINYSWTLGGQLGQDTATATAHVAVNDDDEAVWFPDCT